MLGLLKNTMAQRIARSKDYFEYKRLKRIRKQTIPQYSHCLNCGEELKGMYCYKCGQYALDAKQNIGYYLKNFLENTYQFDGRFFQTLRSLIINPGFLSREYAQGRINSYMHPMKLYMFISVLFFSFILMLFSKIDLYQNILDAENEMQQKEFASQLTDEEKVRLSEAINIVDVINNDATNEKKINIDIAIKDKEESGALASVAPLKDNEINFTSGEGVHIGFLDKLDKTTTNRIYREVYGMVTNILPFILLLLIPVYGLILKLGYSKTNPFYIENLVFSFHIHSFFVLFFGLFILLSYFLNMNCFPVFIVLFVVYHVIAIKQFYNKTWIKSILRSALTLTIYSFLVFCVILSFGITISYRFIKEYDLLNI